MTVLLALALMLPGGPPAPNVAVAEGRVPDHRLTVVAPYRPWLRRLAWCESTDNPRAVNPSGVYLGLYQFDMPTWRSVGGRGWPHRAARLEQSYRAVLLRRQRGTAPWPVCG